MFVTRVHARTCLGCRIHYQKSFGRQCPRRRYSGTVEEGVALTQRTRISFTWRLRAADLDITREVQLLLKNALRQGVPMPRDWKGRMNVLSGVSPLDELAEAAERRAREDHGLPVDVKLSCRTSVM